MRIVMLTDDAKSVDRRILLEAESLIDEGHEVIVIARHVGDAPTADRLGRVKVLWIDLELGYLGGAYDGLDVDKAPKRDGMTPETEAELASLRGQLVAAGVAHMTAKLDLVVAERASAQAGAARRLLTGPGLAWKRLVNARAAVQRSKAADAFRAAPDPADFANLPEMNVWERALFFRTLFLDPDVVHAHDLPQLLAGVYAKRFLKVPLVYDAHEVYPQISTLTAEESRLLHDKEAQLLKYCDVRITVNPFCARLMEYCYDCEPFEVILNATVGESLGRLQESRRNRLREQLNLAPGTKILMYQGWIADVGRGLVELVQAFPQIREDVHLVMMGYGAIDDFRRIAQEAGVGHRIHLLPPVPWHELVSWSSEADAGIIPYQPVDFNHRVCSPNKLFEFVAARLPIICNDLPFLREVVEGQGFGLVHPMSNAREMAEAINRAFDPEARRLESAREALKRKGADWEWPVEAGKLKAIYARLPLPERYKGLPTPPKAMLDLDRLLT